MYTLKTLTFLLTTSTFALAQGNPLVNHRESIYNGGAYSLAPLSPLSLLIVAGMTMPFTTALALGISNIAFASASPIGPRDDGDAKIILTDWPIWARDDEAAKVVLNDGPAWVREVEKSPLMDLLEKRQPQFCGGTSIIDIDCGPAPVPLSQAKSDIIDLARDTAPGIVEHQTYSFPGLEGTQLNAARVLAPLLSPFQTLALTLAVVGISWGFSRQSHYHY